MLFVPMWVFFLGLWISANGLMRSRSYSLLSSGSS
jgi:hypothetical protein